MMTFGMTGNRDFLWVPIDRITVNPDQPRKVFREEELSALTESIARYGILTPLTVRRDRQEGRYQLIAGERRLRAASRAGLRKLTREFGMTQKQAAEQVGKTQPAVANKIRLLKLDPQVVALVRAEGLSERHARALLRLEDPAEQLAAAEAIAKKAMNVERAEQYIQKLLDKPAPRPKPKVVLRDLRLFYNSVSRALDTLKLAGLPATMEKEEEEGKTRIIICVG